jgi:hypothetical protein
LEAFAGYPREKDDRYMLSRGGPFESFGHDNTAAAGDDDIDGGAGVIEVEVGLPVARLVTAAGGVVSGTDRVVPLRLLERADQLGTSSAAFRAKKTKSLANSSLRSSM